MIERESSLNADWLEADGLGGFALGTVSAVRTRRCPVLLTATHPPRSQAEPTAAQRSASRHA